ncbi:FAD/NAD(P)-binding protein [Streptomyces sp. NPDC126503]|uniref:FAD/NAD(P)-binding protein n=1 Tax=Streptomyces sp. NPDC126503 TaxID=3155315 RepID=UPI00331C6540
MWGLVGWHGGGAHAGADHAPGGCPSARGGETGPGCSPVWWREWVVDVAGEGGGVAVGGARRHGDGRDVVVVGGGVAGCSVVVQLLDAVLRPQQAAGGPVRVRSVRVVDPHPVGWGLAFGDDDPLLLCNSAVALNSLRAEAADDFLDHLRQQGWEGAPQECVPRGWVAQYCRTRFDQARARAAARGIEVGHLSAVVRSVEAAPGGYRVRLVGGGWVPADDVVVCAGVHRPRVPDGFAVWQSHPRYLDSPYPSARLRRHIGRSPSRVLVTGSRQSAVDAAMMLCRDGHRVTLASRSGQLPAVRASLAPPPRPFPPLQRMARLDPADPCLTGRIIRCVVEAVRMAGPLPLRHQVSTAANPVRRLHEETVLAETGACAWAHVGVPLIEAVIALGSALPAERRRTVQEHFAPLAGRYITAIALPNARRLLGHLKTGHLRLAGRYPAAVHHDGDTWRVCWPDAPVETFDQVVNATGFQPPQLYWEPTTPAVYLDDPPPAPAQVVDHLAADLRVRSHPTAPPERVWIVGVATHIRIPYANHLPHVVTQAHHAAAQLLYTT